MRTLKYTLIPEATETFRWTCQSSPHRIGYNVHTQPLSLRYYLEPHDRNHIFVQPDLKAAENVIVAYLSGSLGMIEAIKINTSKLYEDMATAIYKQPVTKKSDPVRYRLGKATILATNYKEGPILFARKNGISVVDSKKYIASRWKLHPEVSKWHKQIYDTIKDVGKLVTPLGRERVFYAAISAYSYLRKIPDQEWKDAIAWIPQTTVPEIINIGMRRVWENLDYAQFYFNHHDSFTSSVPWDMVREYIETVAPYFKVPMRINGRDVTLELEWCIGYNWSDLFEYKGENLSREQWQKMVDEKLKQKTRRQIILEGTYGPYLYEKD